MRERRKILEENIRPIENHVQLSEYHLIKTPKELSLMVAKVSSLFLFLISFSTFPQRNYLDGEFFFKLKFDIP